MIKAIGRRSLAAADYAIVGLLALVAMTSTAYAFTAPAPGDLGYDITTSS